VTTKGFRTALRKKERRSFLFISRIATKRQTILILVIARKEQIKLVMNASQEDITKAGSTFFPARLMLI
jgi:hypothetical protein